MRIIDLLKVPNSTKEVTKPMAFLLSRQSRLDARYWMLGAGALGRPRGMVRGRGKEEGSG